MSGKEKLMLVIIALVVVWFSMSQRKRLLVRSRTLKERMQQIEPKREALELLSLTKKRLSEVRKKFELKDSTPLQQIVYGTAKRCNMKMLMAIPKKERPYMNLLDEVLSVQLEGTYDELICFVNALEQIENRGFIYISNISIPKRAKEEDKDGNRYYIEVKVHRLSVAEKK